MPKNGRAMGIIKTEPKQKLSDREVLAGLVERVTYQNAENGHCVIRVKARGGQWTPVQVSAILQPS